MNIPEPVLISPPAADIVHMPLPSFAESAIPSVKPAAFISTGSNTAGSYANVIESPSDEIPMELFIETTTSTFVSVNELVSFSQTLGRNCTYTASVGMDSDSIGVELPATYNLLFPVTRYQ